MICQHCGKEIEEGLSFCTCCGEPQEEGAKRPVPEQKQSGVLVPVLIVLAFAAAVFALLWLFVFKGADAPAAPQEEKGAPVPTETAAQLPTEPEEDVEIPRVVVDETIYKTMAEKFAQAILLRDPAAIREETHPLLQEPFAEKFGDTDFVFESCTVNASELRKLRRTEERAQEAALREEFGVVTAIDDAYAVTVAFEAVYQGKTYGGAIIVVVADMKDDNGAEQHYVIMSMLAAMDEAFYEDNFAPGDHYFDTHSEE
ncbi:MAG: zinc ribbon domain-containing protein [Oscillospiraceae bacterium]|nr:zinc ribbon domain-containing protein [Oscillospiraceae bacterium]